MKVKFIFLIKIITIMGLLIFLTLFFIRTSLSKQIDDVNPLIRCENSLLEKSESLSIIPIYDNVSINEYPEWCNYILSLNKTLIMHGVYHNYQEFLNDVNIEDIQRGKEEFKECFGFYPLIFEAPQLELSKSNVVKLKESGLKIRNKNYNLFHKVYHCSDTGRLSNNFIDNF